MWKDSSQWTVYLIFHHLLPSSYIFSRMYLFPMCLYAAFPKVHLFSRSASPMKEQSWADSSLQYFLDSRVPSIVRGHINLIAPFPEKKKTCHSTYTQDMGRSTLTSETIEFGTFFRDTPAPSAPESPRQAHTLLYVTLWEEPHSDPRQST